MTRFLVILPLALSIVAFVLSMLAILAGHDKGFMEEYAIVRLNTSAIGHNMIDLDGDDKDDKDDDDGGFLGDLENTWHHIEGDLQDGLNNITGDLADKLARTLGVSEWYSIHVMDACYGNYAPNATAKGASNNVTNCTTESPTYRFDLTKIINGELDKGPFDITLSDIHWPDKIQDTIDTINDALLGLFVVYVLGAGFSGLAILTCVVAFVLAGKRSIAFVNLALASLAAICILVGSIIVTVAATKGVKEINKIGDDVGLSAKTGSKFLIISWVAAGVMIISTIYWLASLCLGRRHKKLDEKHRRGSY